MRMVTAKCLAFAWDSVACRGYDASVEYEIDADSQLATLTTIRGDWMFQYPGHEGRAPDKEKVVPVASTATIKEIVEAKAETVKVDKRKVPMTAERKAQLALALAKGRAAKKARIAEMAAA